MINFGVAFMKTKAFMRKNIGHIAYYGCVALALTALALASDHFRNPEAEEIPVVLPVVAAETPKPAQPLFTVDTRMQLIHAYSAAPEWNAAMKCWQPHTGTDFSCADGKVYSLSAGRVLTTGESGIYGGFAEVECEGYLLRYCSVYVNEGIKPGSQLRAGDEIGMAANEIHAETHMGPHLHLEVYRDGESLDFAAIQHELFHPDD